MSRWTCLIWKRRRNSFRGSYNKSRERKKLLQMIDRLDSGDRHDDQKYQDMSDRLDNLYDRISEIDEEIAGEDARIQAAYEKQLTGKNVYQFPLDYDILCERMTDLEKKQFMRTFIESIELYPEKPPGDFRNRFHGRRTIDGKSYEASGRCAFTPLMGEGIRGKGKEVTISY